MNKIIKLIIGSLLMVAGIYLLFTDTIGWGICLIFLAVLSFLLFFFNEYILLTFWQMRKQDLNKAGKMLAKIKHPEKQLHKSQFGYYHYMLGLTEAQSNIKSSEKNMKEALKYGLKFGHDRAIAKLNLAAGMARQGKRKDVERLLKEARAEDKQGMVSSQIDLFEEQLKNAKPQVSRNPRQRPQGRSRYF